MKKVIISCIAVVALGLIVYYYFGSGGRISPLARIAGGMIKRGNWDGGIQLLEFNARLFPGSVNAHTSLGRAYFYFLRGSGTIVSVDEKRVGVAIEAGRSEPDLVFVTGLLFGNAVRGWARTQTNDFDAGVVDR